MVSRLSTKMRYVAIFIVLFATHSYAQHFKSKCGDETVSFRNGGLNHFEPIIHCNFIEVPMENDFLIPEFINKVNEENLKKNLGEEFIRQKLIKLKKIIIEEDTSNKNQIGIKKYSNKLCNCNCKYAFQYYFKIHDSINYYFTTIYNSSGQLAIKNPIPNIPDNSFLATIIPMCNAKTIAESDFKFKGKLENITIEYNWELKRFTWLAEKPAIYKGNGNRKVHSRFLVIDAINGEIIDRYIEKGIVVCRLPSNFW